MSEDLLGQLVAADRAARPVRPSFRVTRIEGRGGVLVRHPKLEGGWIRVPRADVEALGEQRLIRLRRKKSKEHIESWEFDLRDAAFEQHDRVQQREQLGRAAPSATAEPSPYDWNGNALPVLMAVGAVLSRLDVDAAAMTFGVPTDLVDEQLGRSHGDGRTAVALKTLADGGYIKAEYESGTLGPSYSLPTSGHQRLALARRRHRVCATP